MNLATRAAGYLSGFKFQFWLTLCLAIAACIPLAYCKGRSDGKALKQAQIDRAVAGALQAQREADEQTNRQRQADDERNRNADEERREAARTGGRAAVNCERLRAAYPDRALPPSC